MYKFVKPALIGLSLITMTSSALAQIDGLYVRTAKGATSTLKLYNCGGGKGLKVIKSTHKPSIGKHIICGAKKKGNKWHGTVHDIENDKTYTGYISLSGRTLGVTGCFLGICKTRTMRKIK